MVDDCLDGFVALLAMSNLNPAEPPRWQQSALRWLPLGYSMFIIYGSFIPFYFNLDPNFIRWRWDTFHETLGDPRLWRYSTPDAVSNLLLFAPLGFFLAVAELNMRAHASALRIAALVTAIGFLLGSAIEIGQTLSPMRSPSPLDILYNTVGSAAGAILGCLFFRQLSGVIAPWIDYLINQRSSLLALLFFLLGPLLDSFYPFEVTLDLSTLWNNLKQSQFTPWRQGWPRQGWHIVVERAFPFAAIGYIVALNLETPRPRANALTAWLVCAGLALAIECGKLFFNGRAFNANNIAYALAGAALGILLWRAMDSRKLTSGQIHAVLIGLGVALLGYFELAPFDWISRPELSWRIQRIEWFPFAAYYWSDPRSALFDLWKKVFLTIPIGFLWSQARSASGAATTGHMILLATAMGAIFETGQIALRSRTPSVTDVMIIVLGVWLGNYGYRLFNSLKSMNGIASRPV